MNVYIYDVPVFVLLFNHQALLAGLCVSCPEDPLHFIKEKILEILENQDLEICWYACLHAQNMFM